MDFDSVAAELTGHRQIDVISEALRDAFVAGRVSMREDAVSVCRDIVEMNTYSDSDHSPYRQGQCIGANICQLAIGAIDAENVG